jgi:hypothetical protein
MQDSSVCAISPLGEDADEITIDKPIAPNEIVKYMYDHPHNFHTLAPVMQQEVRTRTTHHPPCRCSSPLPI